jgi:hypothetical protein
MRGAERDLRGRLPRLLVRSDMQPEPVRGSHKDAREAPIWVGPFGASAIALVRNACRISTWRGSPRDRNGARGERRTNHRVAP